MIRFTQFTIDKERLRREFYYERNKDLREWFFVNYSKEVRDKIQERYYSNLHKCQLQIDFFPWFKEYKFLFDQDSVNVQTSSKKD